MNKDLSCINYSGLNHLDILQFGDEDNWQRLVRLVSHEAGRNRFMDERLEI